LPDFFGFGEMAREQLQVAIGNAVPPKIVTALLMGLLR
jgi:site-specific DNA-cytosine methylase